MRNRARRRNFPRIHIKTLIVCSIVGTGVSSVVTQLLTIREFISQFQGNEITISLVLFSWLVMGGLGSLAAKAVRNAPLSTYSLLMAVACVWPLVQLIGIRLLHDQAFVHGVSSGFYSVFACIAIATAPYCLLIGFVLPYALYLLKRQDEHYESGHLYLTDGIGDVLGGALFSFLLVYFLKPFPTVAVASAPLIAVTAILFLRNRNFPLLALFLVGVTAFFSVAASPEIQRETLALQYGHIVHYRESPYGRIVISKEGDQRTVWASGTPIHSGPDVILCEEKVHYPLSQLPDVADVLLVGGGLGGTIDEISKYGPSRVDYVELDPALTEEAKRLGLIPAYPFLHVANTDGRRYIQRTGRTYDAVILDLPDPDTFQLNRFFTDEFFALAKGVLRPGGVLSLTAEYSPNYIGEIRKKKLSILYRTARRHFENVMVLPGEKAYFLCREGPLTADIPARLNAKSIETSYVEGYYHGNVTKERIRRLRGTLDEDGPLNRDFEPVLMKTVFEEWFAKFDGSPKVFFAVLAVLAAAYAASLRKEEYVLFTTGLTAMGVEMLVVYAFQVMYGYVYLEIGAIVTVFLLGLLPGAFFGLRGPAKSRRMLLAAEGLLIALLACALAWFGALKGSLHPAVFLAYCFAFSLVCGFQFPVAAGLIGEENSPAAGCLAADLTGAAVGTLAVGTVLIPLFGLKLAAFCLIAVKASSTLLVMISGNTR